MPLAHINGTTCHYRSDGDRHRPCDLSNIEAEAAFTQAVLDFLQG
jgi:hypothetical protein